METTSGGPSDTVVHTPFPSLFLSLLPGADPFPLQLEKAGLPYSSTGFRTTDIFIAGEDRAGREGSIRKGLFVDDIMLLDRIQIPNQRVQLFFYASKALRFQL